MRYVISAEFAGGSNALVIGFPEGGRGTQADVGEYVDFKGTATNFYPCDGGNVGT